MVWAEGACEREPCEVTLTTEGCAVDRGGWQCEQTLVSCLFWYRPSHYSDTIHVVGLEGY